MQHIFRFSRQPLLWLVLIALLAACRSVALEQDVPLGTPEDWPAPGTVVQLPVVEAPATDSPDPAPGELPPDAGQSADGSGEGAEPPAEPQPPAEEPPAGRVTHVIQPGETVGLIAQRYAISITALATHNNIQDVNRITAGATLEIPTREEAAAIDAGTGQPGAEAPSDPAPAPAPGFDPDRFVSHTVRQGETVFSIGRFYGFTVEELAAYNNLADPRLIYAGDVIRIPVR
jgi:LysM repeat protein